MTDEALKDIRQKMNESLPNETEDLFDYVDLLRNEFARMTQFVCEDNRSSDITEEWLKTKKYVKRACALLGLEGEKILANCGPEMRPL